MLQLIASRQEERRIALETVSTVVTRAQLLETNKKLERELPVTLHSVRYRIRKMKDEYFRLSLRHDDNRGMLELLRGKIEREQELEIFLGREKADRLSGRKPLGDKRRGINSVLN